VSVAVFVPVAGKLEVIDRGSGIVGDRWVGDEVLIDYEGNRYGYANVKTFADRCARAYDRQSVSYPTVARMVVHRDALIQVGTFDQDQRVVYSENDAALREWLGLDDVEHIVFAAELRCSE
jgi:hypothetical protein